MYQYEHEQLQEKIKRLETDVNYVVEALEKVCGPLLDVRRAQRQLLDRMLDEVWSDLIWKTTDVFDAARTNRLDISACRGTELLLSKFLPAMRNLGEKGAGPVPSGVYVMQGVLGRAVITVILPAKDVHDHAAANPECFDPAFLARLCPASSADSAPAADPASASVPASAAAPTPASLVHDATPASSSSPAVPTGPAGPAVPARCYAAVFVSPGSTEK